LKATDPGLSDPRVRQAIAMAVDRPSAVRAAFAGFCLPNFQIFPVGSLGYDAKMKNPYPFSVTKAKKLLSDAGASSLTIELPYNSALPMSAAALQAQLAAIGVKANIRSALTADMNAQYGSGSLGSMHQGVPSGPDPALIVNTIIGANINMDKGDPQLATLTTAALKAPPASREADFQAVNAQAIKNADFVGLCQPISGQAARVNILNADTLPYGGATVDFRYIAKAKSS
jgi:ABC-type transport system substrate-binding protein